MGGTNSADDDPDKDKEKENYASEAKLEANGLGFHCTVFIYSVVASVPCVICSMFFSSMGRGEETREFLERNHENATILGGAVGGVVLVLYLADFFWPPHLPGKYCRLWESDKVLGRFIVLALILMTIAAGLFAAKEVPSVPLILIMLSGPALLVVVRACLQPARSDEPDVFKQIDKSRGVSNDQREVTLRHVVGGFKETRMFYAGAMVAFGLTGVGQFLVWIVWIAGRGDANLHLGSDTKENSLEYLNWISPAVISLGNIGFSFIISLRLRLAKSYDDALKAQVELNLSVTECDDVVGMRSSNNRQRRMSRKSVSSIGRRKSVATISQMQASKFKTTREVHLRQLSDLVKAVGCSMFVLILCVYAAAQLVATESFLANLLLTCLSTFFVIFNVFMIVSFRKVFYIMRDWMHELPVWRLLKSVSQNEWARALSMVVVLPFVPFMFIMSLANQWIRRCRGLYRRIPPIQLDSAPVDVAAGQDRVGSEIKEEDISCDPCQSDQLLTARLVYVLQKMRWWNWISIVEKMYIMGMLITCYTLTPRLLNVFLVWLIASIENLHFSGVLAATFICGLCCFLLPPVPGVPVYLFAGLVLGSTCPWGFWPGSIIAVGLGWILKLTACAIQQRVIGGSLGYSLRIKSQVGVHKPLIRAIERVLSEPGLSIGKCAIACGGPDWPTSVLAGLLELSLAEMEMATIPIIFFVAPCTLSGSFYYKVDESEVWARSANLMLQLSVIGALVMQILSAWAIQGALDKHNHEITKPLVKNVDLDWLDYCGEQVKKATAIDWGSLPCIVQAVFIIGLILEVITAQLFYWSPQSSFGDFPVTANISDLKWYDDDNSGGLVKPSGAVGLTLAAIGCLGWLVENRYLRSKCAQDLKRCKEELQLREESWKRVRRSLARDAEGTWPLAATTRAEVKEAME